MYCYRGIKYNPQDLKKQDKKSSKNLLAGLTNNKSHAFNVIFWAQTFQTGSNSPPETTFSSQRITSGSMAFVHAKAASKPMEYLETDTNSPDIEE